MNVDDYYQILGVHQNASAREIKEAYRRLAFQYHPDRNLKNPGSADQMKKVNEAYAVLSNAAKRRGYDTFRNRFGEDARQQFRQSYSERDIFSETDIQSVFEEMARAFGLRGFHEIFKETYGPNFRTFQVHRPDFFTKGYFFFGSRGQKTPKNLSNNAPGTLNRLGNYLLKKLIPGGIPEKGADIRDSIVLNPTHALEGGPYAYYLRHADKKLIVKVPKGVKNGQVIRLTKMGKVGKHGGEPGDVLLQVKIKKPWTQKVREKITR